MSTRKMTTTPIVGLLPAALERRLVQLGLPVYRTEQVFRWIHQSLVTSFDQMSNLPAELRALLYQHFTMTTWSEVAQQQSADGSIKWLLRADDHQTIETVLMQHRGRHTQCISTQVGCKFGCRFCASGLYGFVRHLRTDEMVAQVLHARRAVPTQQSPHLVVMGMGEPFDNYDQLIPALRILNHPLGLQLGKRKMTISTVGLPKKILRFSQEELPVELSISLHSAINEVRSQLMPVNQAFPVQELLRACWAYTERTNRLITFEYIMIDGLNSDRANAEALVKALERHPAKVNLIPYNPIAEFPATRPPMNRIRTFQRKLTRAGIPTTVRFSKGGSIDAACGQLRLQDIHGTRAQHQIQRPIRGRSRSPRKAARPTRSSPTISRAQASSRSGSRVRTPSRSTARTGVEQTRRPPHRPRQPPSHSSVRPTSRRHTSASTATRTSRQTRGRARNN
jgi:23S rRNA (adenine2503-C2)-methyltransferase